MPSFLDPAALMRIKVLELRAKVVVTLAKLPPF
jgi:hypothetical protein